jgi:heterodisulfide reductase subunit C
MEMLDLTAGSSKVADVSANAEALNREVSDEALEAAVGDFREVRCSQCGGTCNSSCSTSTR